MVCYVNETAVYSTDKGIYDVGVDGAEAATAILDDDVDDIQGYINSLFTSETLDYPGCAGAAWDAAWGRETGDPIRSEDFSDLRDRIDYLHDILCCTTYCPTHESTDLGDYNTSALLPHYSLDYAPHYVGDNTGEHSPYYANVESGDKGTHYTGDDGDDNTTHLYDYDSDVQGTYQAVEELPYCGTHRISDEDSHDTDDKGTHLGGDKGSFRSHDSAMA